MGTSCRRSSRRVAVTTTSDKPPASVPSVCARSGIPGARQASAAVTPKTARRFIIGRPRMASQSVRVGGIDLLPAEPGREYVSIGDRLRMSAICQGQNVLIEQNEVRRLAHLDGARFLL